MRSHYKRIGDYVTLVKLKNSDGAISSLKGININKHFMPSVANVNGTDLSTYRVVKKNQFAFNPMHVGRDEVLPISMLEDDEPIIVSPAYVVFEVKDEEELLPAYLMMWCRRSEFDRNAWFMTDNSVRGGFSWTDFCDMELPIPSIEKQREIVREYNVVNDRIALNDQLTQKLEDTAQAIYKQWFVDFEFPISKEYAESIGKPELEGKPYKSSGGEMEYCEELETNIPSGWSFGNLSDISDLIDGDRGKNYPSKEQMKDQGYCLFLNTGNVTKKGFLFENLCFIDQERDLLLRKGKLQVNDVVLTTRGTIGNVARFSSVNPYKHMRINSGMLIIRPKSEEHSGFIFSLLQSVEMKIKIESFLSGSAQPQLPIKDLVKINIINPDGGLVLLFKEIINKINDNIDVIKNSQVQLKNLSQIILQRISKA
ncbi:restriction endonuclease subunit S [Escherichia coli]|uniref:restriction endonuclease subunit S n=1 Tax=Escherichia coli TaxID=562 RepID=UPI000B7EA4F2|nr:restriction endonuclease subunit S [Escherichia coli]EFC5153518.1 restriction endonuclease subunit S [Escherichia coli]EFC5167282.1 restriction endonuclease subunit S [Escherichia coli]EFH1615533.1 restriction endonuclease subunit S [Escherichia coli]EFT7141337.1 restriction endonuclease subunit S [Escherichia coli]EGL7834487.1 restriction endonuclease subunit S [Escherichia coli]